MICLPAKEANMADSNAVGINYAELHCVDLFAGFRGRGNFLLNLSLGPGGSL